jgi:hypothetical protein
VSNVYEYGFVPLSPLGRRHIVYYYSWVFLSRNLLLTLVVALPQCEWAGGLLCNIYTQVLYYYY